MREPICDSKDASIRRVLETLAINHRYPREDDREFNRSAWRCVAGIRGTSASRIDVESDGALRRVYPGIVREVA